MDKQSLAAISSFANIDEPVTFLLYVFFFKLRGYTTNFRIQKQFWKYYPICPKNP